MSVAVIVVSGLGKRYRIGERQRYMALRDVLADSFKAPWRLLHRPAGSASNHGPRHIWALRDASFEVKAGEVVGIIGRNGAGKSTLLKILARITKPTEGYGEVRGRMGSLLEVGTGFHPELTGRENIFLSGAILGMKKAEIKQKFDEIVAFAEIEKFLDTPAKHYSSGMYVRLAFAVAAHLDPEILLVDEVLAVGDAAFQKKCLRKMGAVAKQGRTILFVSHNMAAIENLCGRAILLDASKVVRQGYPHETINYYLGIVLPNSLESVSLDQRMDRLGNGRVRLTSFHIEDVFGKKLSAARNGTDAVFVFGFQCREGENPKNIDVGFSISSSHDQMLFVLYASYTGQTFPCIPTSGVFRCCVRKLPLSPGRYRVGARVCAGGEEADWPQDGIAYLDVEAGDFFGTGSKGFEGGATPFLVNGRWEVREAWEEHRV